jgi:hypothetical protein
LQVARDGKGNAHKNQISTLFRRSGGFMKKRVLMVLTRDIPATPTNGRERTLSFIRDALRADAKVTEFKIRSVFETGSFLVKLGAASRLAEGLLRGVPCALQVAMFSNALRRRTLLDTIHALKPDLIYVDGVRLVDYVVLIRENVPGCRIIVDFDDLMSRRANILREAALPVSPGYLDKSIPKPFVKIVNSKLIRSVVLRYEALALKRHESRAVNCANAVTLVSLADAATLTQSLNKAARKKVHVIAPPMDLVKPLMRPSSPLRFVFIGSDSQLQNRLAIEYLVALWRRLLIPIPLVIFGKMSGPYESVSNVVFAGFAKTLDDVYTQGSIALCPTFLRGGIKSKVIEAISYGCVPVGNLAAYEGLGFSDDALAMKDARLEQFVIDPVSSMDLVLEAAVRFAAYCDRNYRTQVFRRRWRELLAPAPRLARPEAALARELLQKPELVEEGIFIHSQDRRL